MIRNLEVLGEAVRCLPEDFRSRYADIGWKKMAGLRDILIHHYFGVDLEIIWDVVQTKLPVLERQIEELLRQHSPDYDK